MPKDTDIPKRPENQINRLFNERPVPNKAKDMTRNLANSDREPKGSRQPSATAITSVSNDTQRRPRRPQKSVSFADDTKKDSVHQKMVSQRRSPTQPKSQQRPPMESILGYDMGMRSPSLNGEGKAENAAQAPFTPVIPTDESPEDAALRRQMIQYNMTEVGTVVAELDLDEEDISYSEDDDDDCPDENSSMEEDEDQFGRTKQRVLTDDYLAEMKALEKRLKNVGPNVDIGNTASTGGQKKEPPSTNGDQPISTEAKPKVPVKKGVRFAPSLDIQEVPPSQELTKSSPTTAPKPPNNPVLSSIIERPPTSSVSTASTNTPPTEPSEFDPALLKQEVATEYHKMRNHMIQRQGGFMADNEQDRAEVPLTEEEGGKKRVSRFKAARLGKRG